MNLNNKVTLGFNTLNIQFLRIHASFNSRKRLYI